MLSSSTLRKGPGPGKPGLHRYDDWSLTDLVDYIDWTPFFRAWELAGTYPAILDDEIVGDRRAAFCRCAENAGADHRGKVADRARRLRFLARAS
jgi:cobalamin-dependent methionine synthase I